MRPFVGSKRSTVRRRGARGWRRTRLPTACQGLCRAGSCVLVGSQTTAGQGCLDLGAWFTAYNGRQTVAASNKEEKPVFKLPRLFSRSAKDT